MLSAAPAAITAMALVPTASPLFLALSAATAAAAAACKLPMPSPPLPPVAASARKGGDGEDEDVGEGDEDEEDGLFGPIGGSTGLPSAPASGTHSANSSSPASGRLGVVAPTNSRADVGPGGPSSSPPTAGASPSSSSSASDDEEGDDLFAMWGADDDAFGPGRTAFVL